MEDPRVIRTKMAFEKALLDLMEKDNFEKISVGKIATAAGMNRSTFYLHYNDKEDLLEKYLSRILAELKEIAHLAPEEYDYTASNPHPLLVRMFEHLKANKQFYQVMLVRDNSPQIVYSVRNIITTLVKKANQVMADHGVQYTLPNDFREAYVVSAYLGIITWWVRKDMPYSPKQLASMLTVISSIGPFKENPFIK